MPLARHLALDRRPVTAGRNTAHQADKIAQSRFIACVACLRPVGRGRCLELNTARAIVLASRTRALVYHVPVDLRDLDEFGWAFSDLLALLANPEHYVLVANTARASSAERAIQQAESSCHVFRNLPHASDQSRPVIKLEVLREDLTSDDTAVIAAARELISDGLEVIPLVSPDLEVVRACAEAGAPFVRVLAGRIGTGEGLDQPTILQKLAALAPVPLFFEGGIGSSDHVREAMRLGAHGVLVNSAFHANPSPVDLCGEMRARIDTATSNS